MPELPEVENFARSLQKEFAGAVLEQVEFHREDIRFPLDMPALHKRMPSGARLLRVERVAKQLVLVFSTGKLYVSLGMSGSFCASEGGHRKKHEHVTWRFSARGKNLAYVDPRRFGFLSLQPPAAAADPLVPIQVQRCLEEAQKKGVARKLRDFLLDQKKIGGVGNIYACEACFRTGVSPLLPVAQLSQRRGQPRKLAQNLSTLLLEAIEAGGSSISTYRNFQGEKGDFSALHQVYGREGEPCLKRSCSGVVQRVVSGGRSVFLCPRCQPIP